MSVNTPFIIPPFRPSVFPNASSLFEEKPGAEVEILLLLSQFQMGAPEQDGPQPPKGVLWWGCL